MKHIIRAASSIADDNDIVIVGSQVILGQHPTAPASLLRSMEAGVYPLNAPERADLIDGSIGEGSPFHETFGYYAQGVGPSTAVLAPEWCERLVPMRSEATRGATGWCLDTHDLVLSKRVAGREKHTDFTIDARRAGLIEFDELLRSLAQLDIEDTLRAAVSARIALVERAP